MLKAVVDMVSLCRTKKVVDLPNRIDKVHYLEFNTIERQAYDSVKFQTAQLLEEAIATDLSRKGTYLNALQWLNSLRLICNHGLLHTKRRNDVFNTRKSNAWNSQTAQKALEDMIDAGVVLCIGCSMNPSESMGEDNSLGVSDFPNPILSECLWLLCGSCLLKKVDSSSKTSICTHRPQCPTAEVSLPGFSVYLQAERSLPIMKPEEVPPKIRALMADLQDCSDGEKMSVPMRFSVRSTDRFLPASFSHAGLIHWTLWS